jgi:hypothetical protein
MKRLGGGQSEGDVVGELFDGTKIYRVHALRTRT